jgi:hypothetical protein
LLRAQPSEPPSTQRSVGRLDPKATHLFLGLKIR